MPFVLLKYRVSVFRDDDKQPDESTENAFVDSGGSLFKWREGRALEDELFLSLTNVAVFKLIERAEELHGTELIDVHFIGIPLVHSPWLEQNPTLDHTKRSIMARCCNGSKKK